jgi:hypothetical protein
MTGKEYADRIASYIVRNFGERGVKVFREVHLGKTIIAKDRKIDVFVLDEERDRALAIECKYQDVQGTTDEKIPYAMADLDATPVPGCIVYAGEGFSVGVVHMLEASSRAARCLPDADLAPSGQTSELDHHLAVTFRWWDVLTRGKEPHVG